MATIRGALAAVPDLDPATIDDLLLGCAQPHSEQGGNLARRVAVQLGLDGLPGTTVNRFCASSLQTTRMAFHAIKAGEGDVFVSAGVDCVSRYPATSEDWSHPAFADAGARTQRTAETNESWRDPRESGELPDVYIAMGQTAENVATLRGISRQEQDELGVRSQQLAARAQADGFFDREITPITLPDGSMMTADESVRPGTTYETVASLEPAFRPAGTVTAANCCPLNDGAAALVVMSDTRPATSGSRRSRGSSPPVSRRSRRRSWASAPSRRRADASRSPA